MASRSATPHPTLDQLALSLSGAADLFLPAGRSLPSADAALLRSFVILHLIGPLLGMIICAFLLANDTTGDYVVTTFTICVALFWLFPLLVRRLGSLEIPAFASVQLLVFVSLFGAYHYGGFNSPFAPWFVVAVLLAFLYSPRLIVPCLAMMGAQIVLLAIYSKLAAPPANRISPDALAPVFIASTLAATLYTSIISVFYTAVKKQGSELAAEAGRHHSTARQLRDALSEARLANQQKSAFLARVSHELRTPLNVVIGYSEMLVEDAALGEKPHREQDLRRITEASRHLLSLVNKVVDLAHIDADDAGVDFAPFDLDDFFDRLADSVAPLAARNGNRLVVEKHAPLGWINGDPLKLRQCLLNLLSNAGKFTSEGDIVLSASRRRNSIGGSILFEVRDTGIGIDEAALARLFHPYRQASADTADRYGGSGLGLSLTKRFCTLMGGSIEVETHPGKGSVFRITLPAGFDVGEKSPADEAAPTIP